MKLLRETIRRLILESACDQVNNKIFHAIEELKHHDLKVKITNDGYDMWVAIQAPDGAEVGYLEAMGSSSYDCHNSFIISQTDVQVPYKGNSGFGALLYDIALESAGDDGLSADRFKVSDDAIRMWNYFYRSSDYIKKPFDNEDGEFTPGNESDDCEAESYLDHGGNWRGDDQEYFQSHPLNNVYYKANKSQPTISCLRENGLIIK